MAAPRITLDPSLESCPDYASAAFKPIRDIMVSGTALTEAEAVTQLSDVWRNDHAARKLDWDTQVQADADQAAADAAAQAAQEEHQRSAAEAAAEAERLEAEKKRPKLPDFDAAVGIADFLDPRVSNFAQKKVENQEYIELWYWTKEGCRDAESFRGGVEADESYGVTHTGSTLSFKPLTAYKASEKVVPDEKLTWDQLSLAKTGFLVAIENAGWPPQHRTALQTFFYALEFHPSRLHHDEHVDNVLVLYQAKARRNWHDMMARKQGFNLALINEKLLLQIEKQYLSKLANSQRHMVRPFFAFWRDYTDGALSLNLMRLHMSYICPPSRD
ncbi:hypothetical protein C8R43DRAFT_904344 [Mycena crocata]|nr:hypothetical protein C8R43DRAFT_904344 [Mycena crocata]